MKQSYKQTNCKQPNKQPITKPYKPTNYNHTKQTNQRTHANNSFLGRSHCCVSLFVWSVGRLLAMDGCLFLHSLRFSSSQMNLNALHWTPADNYSQCPRLRSEHEKACLIVCVGIIFFEFAKTLTGSKTPTRVERRGGTVKKRRKTWGDRKFYAFFECVHIHEFRNKWTTSCEV